MEMRLPYHSVVHLLALVSASPIPSLPLGNFWICRPTSSKYARHCKDKSRENHALFHAVSQAIVLLATFLCVFLCCYVIQ